MVLPIHEMDYLFVSVDILLRYTVDRTMGSPYEPFKLESYKNIRPLMQNEGSVLNWLLVLLKVLI